MASFATRLASLLAAASLAGCAGSSAPPLQPVSGTPSYLRHIAPFDVLDEAGVPYDFPFLGGLNVPRPQLVDIDGDGDLDLFLQEATGRVMFFERAPGAEPRFLFRSDRFADLDVGEWYRFADLDGDGDADLLAEQPFSFARYYRNEGSRTAPRFRQVGDSLRDARGQPLFSDRQNIPNVTDLDCDGQLDLFLGRVDGTVTRYESVGYDRDTVPRFAFVQDRFEGIEIVVRIGSLHGANTLAFHDVDGDGDEDLFWGDFFESGLLLIENTGSCRAPVLRNPPLPFPAGNPLSTSGYNAPAWGDLDGDGDADLLVGVLGGAYNPNRTSRDNVYYYERTGPAGFTLRTRRFVRTVDVGNESIPALADLDGDGDLDLVLANKIEPDSQSTSWMYFFENTGTRAAPAFRLRGPLPIAGIYHYAPAFGDLDGDGDLDLVLGNWRASLVYYRNNGSRGTRSFVLADSALVTITRGSNTTPALGDVDGDGDLDLFVGEASGTINFYRNTGTATQPAFTLESDEYLGIDPGRRSAPTLADLDGDGDLDLIVGSESGELQLWRNTGTRTAPRFVLDPAPPLLGPPFSAPAYGDLDGDGDLDLIVGGLGGGVVYFEARVRP